MEQIDLKKYLPPLLSRVTELSAICSAEDPELEQARTAFIAVCVNLFVTTCGEAGIYRFEQELGITANTNDTLEERITRVIAYKAGSSVYTMQWLRRWLPTMGAVDAPLLTDHTLKVIMPSKSDYKTLFDLLVTFIPANINLLAGIKFLPTEQQLYTGMAVRFSTKRTVEGESAVLPAFLADENESILTDEDGKYLIE